MCCVFNSLPFCLFFQVGFSSCNRGVLCDIRVILGFTMYLYICLFYVLVWRFRMSKIHLYVKCRKQGCYIASIPLKQLIKLAASDKRRWEYKDGWLILEAM